MLSLPYFFECIDNAKLNQVYESNVLTVKGLEDGQLAPVSITNGVYAVDLGDGFTPYIDASMMVENGARLRVSLTTGNAGGTVHETRLKIGDHVIRYCVTTMVTVDVDKGLPPCKNCGGAPLPADFGGCTEMYGNSWQSGEIECSNRKATPPCCNNVSIQFEADDYTCDRTMQLEHMWAILNTPNKCKEITNDQGNQAG